MSGPSTPSTPSTPSITVTDDDPSGSEQAAERGGTPPEGWFLA
ncbi:hypothetical protein [Nocardioides albus]|uniref:Uncharacterized protein n=1 Tax=Nocardioides albus TaxID=1841 RepID=A0A7W5A1Q3_9ACTN|nr:hypothetical protein [Nocardioides albus]MBB3087858.1 hypothetical protein [Nocardioides albus]